MLIAATLVRMTETAKPVVKTSGVQMAATTASRTSRQVVPMAAAVLRPAVISNGVPIAAMQARRAVAVPTAATVMRPAVISNGVPMAATQARRAVVVPTAAAVVRPAAISNGVPMARRTEVAKVDMTAKRLPKTAGTMMTGSILRSGIVTVEDVLVLVNGGLRTRVS